MTNTQFPLVADGVPIIDTAKQMALYENEDLITNIHGYYQDKDYDDVTKITNLQTKSCLIKALLLISVFKPSTKVVAMPKRHAKGKTRS